MAIKAILEEAGSELSKVVKCNIFLDDMANFAEMNIEYEKHFSHKPARSCVAVKALPKGVPVEIECELSGGSGEELGRSLGSGMIANTA
jgi:2-iminobutanoate/2-iminopropanoate deaminase